MAGLTGNLTKGLSKVGDTEWRIAPQGAMRVPVVLYATEALIRDMDEKVLEQAANVATLPGIVGASYAMPDAHWGYGFPIGGVAAFDADAGGVVSAGGVGFDISCGVRTLHTGLDRAAVMAVQQELANALYDSITVGVGSTGAIRLDRRGMDAMLTGGAAWAVRAGYGRREDLERIEERGCIAGADPGQVSEHAKERQRQEMGTLGSGNHYLEVQVVAEIDDPATADAFGLRRDAVVVSIHCGSRGLGHQIGTDYLKRMVVAAPRHGLALPDRDLACAPIHSALGQAYLGAMRAGINCALANRQIPTHLTRRVFTEFFGTDLTLLYDVSHNTCKLEEHRVDGRLRKLYVHRKGATRAFGSGHPDLPPDLRDVGQPVLIGGTMGTASYILVGTERGADLAFASACHGAGRALSRHAATKRWHGRAVQDELARRGILVRSPSARGLAEEAPGAYKDVGRWSRRPSVPAWPAGSRAWSRWSVSRADPGADPQRTRLWGGQVGASRVPGPLRGARPSHDALWVRRGPFGTVQTTKHAKGAKLGSMDPVRGAELSSRSVYRSFAVPGRRPSTHGSSTSTSRVFCVFW